jgi:hypothetical protein
VGVDVPAGVAVERGMVLPVPPLPEQAATMEAQSKPASMLAGKRRGLRTDTP